MTKPKDDAPATPAAVGRSKKKVPADGPLRLPSPQAMAVQTMTAQAVQAACEKLMPDSDWLVISMPKEITEERIALPVHVIKSKCDSQKVAALIGSGLAAIYKQDPLAVGFGFVTAMASAGSAMVPVDGALAPDGMRMAKETLS